MHTFKLVLFIGFIALFCGSNGVPCSDAHNYAFVIDESGSVGSTNYVKSIDFVKNIISNHVNSVSNIAALAFGSVVDFIYGFNEDQTSRTSILNLLEQEKTDFAASLTHTDTAMRAAITQFKNNNFNDKNIIILVTDGVPYPAGHDPCVADILTDLQTYNIRVAIVGVSGGFNSAPVACLVSDPNDIITIPSFNDFAAVITQLEATQVLCNDCDDYNPCTQENIDAGKFHHPSCESCCQFVQCDAWGNMYEMPCAAGTYWNADMVWPGQDHNMGQCTDPGCSFSPNYVVVDEYYLLAGSLTFDQAQAACQANGGNLASIHSQEDFDTVETLCDSYSINSDTNCHIGMQYNYGTGKWYWIDGSARDFGFNVNGDVNGQTPPWEGSWAWDAAESNSGCQIMDLNGGTGYFDDNNCAAQYPAICYGPPLPAQAKSVGTSNDLGDNIKQVEYPDIDYKNNNNNHYSYYAVIVLIGVIAFVLINNIFIGCWCLRKNNNNKVKFEMVGDEEI